MAFIGWKEPPYSQFPPLEPGACRGTKYSNLWASNNPKKKKNNVMVFHDYYMLLLSTVATIPRIDSPVVDLYHSKLEFKVDRDKTYIRPKGFRKHKDWAPGPYRMNIQKVEDTIRDYFDEDMKQMYDDLSTGIVPVDAPEDAPVIDPQDKGKEPMGSKERILKALLDEYQRKGERKSVFKKCQHPSRQRMSMISSQQEFRRRCRINSLRFSHHRICSTPTLTSR